MTLCCDWGCRSQGAALTTSQGYIVPSSPQGVLQGLCTGFCRGTSHGRTAGATSQRQLLTCQALRGWPDLHALLRLVHMLGCVMCPQMTRQVLAWMLWLGWVTYGDDDDDNDDDDDDEGRCWWQRRLCLKFTSKFEQSTGCSCMACNRQVAETCCRCAG